MAVAIYARVSSKEQSEAEQIPEIIRYFHLKPPYEIFEEKVSAWNIEKADKRLEFKRLIDCIKEKRFNRLYVWDLDRIYRNRIKTKEFYAMCDFYGVRVFSLNQSWLNDFQELVEQFPKQYRFLLESFADIMLNVYAQSAEDESTKKSKRVRLKIVKDKKGVTRSTKGKKWGRRSLPTRVVEDVLQLYSEGKSVRFISKNVFYYDKNKNLKNLSVGSVHKIIVENKGDLDT